ncbi:amino acid transporter-like protein [Byssothecium circinans]|uniref:Amino acid transporter-like protein n=1 Tax=Byssothecium circinans TaxID=147558 RepID=A0A6A5TVW0_9PLEO|nr:amino acid transporter-like protein [Byssothecium circinans]
MISRHVDDKDAISTSAPITSLVFDEKISIVPQKYHGTDADRHEMHMLGKKQVLRRNFSFLTMLGFASTCIASWEGILTYLNFILIDGGTPLLFWGFLACATCQTLVYASLAEMSSMSPTAGGQYHWVSEFSPRKYQKVLSYYSGWLTAVGWQVYLASVCFLVGTMIQGLIALNDPNYPYLRWHGTLLAIAIVVFTISFNTIFASKLPLVEGIALAVHISGFLAIIITLWVMAPRRSAADALLNFTNEGGWSSTGLSSMIGLLAPMAVLVGYDCSVHMSEEIKDASIILPRAIMGSVVLNVTLVLTLIITLCFTLGDPAEALASPTGYAFIQVFYNATQSVAGTSVLTFIVIFMMSVCAVSEAAACSRQIWAFARDAGLPGHSWLSKVSPHWNIPLPGIIVSLTISALLTLINIGSSVALNAITSLGAVATLISYYLTIGCLVHRRLYGAPLPPRRWSLGRFGIVVNVAALVLLTPLIFFLTWPLTTPVTAQTMNWSSVMLAGVFIIATVYYLVKGRREYEGPVVHVKRDEE